MAGLATTGREAWDGAIETLRELVESPQKDPALLAAVVDVVMRWRRVDRKQRQSALALAAGREVVDAFDDFWALYPRRNGRKAGRKQALDVWMRMSADERIKAMVGLEHYASGAGDFPVDAERYLRNRRWEDEVSDPVESDHDDLLAAATAAYDARRGEEGDEP